MTMAREALHASRFDREPPGSSVIAEKNSTSTEQVVDLMTGEHYKDAYAAINPSRMVPRSRTATSA